MSVDQRSDTATAVAEASIDGLLREGSRKPGKLLVPTDDVQRLIALTCSEPPGEVIHVILDNYGTHKHPKVMAWLERHPRWIFHFTPASGSWINAVETFFSTLTRRSLKRGVFHSVVDLQAAVKHYIDEHNDDPKPMKPTPPQGAGYLG